MKQNPYYPDSPAGNKDYGPNDNRSRPEINDGGPAFPSPEYDEDGMSLRDWFAGQAMKGLISTLSSELVQGQLAKEMKINGIHERRVEWQLAKNAYDYADAMLAQRNKK